MSKGKLGSSRRISIQPPNVRVAIDEREVEELKDRAKRGNTKASSTLISKAGAKRKSFLAFLS